MSYLRSDIAGTCRPDWAAEEIEPMGVKIAINTTEVFSLRGSSSQKEKYLGKGKL